MRAVKKGVFIRGHRFSAEGLLTIDGMVSNTVVEGSMTCTCFLQYLELEVVSYHYLSIILLHICLANLLWIQVTIIFTIPWHS